MSLVRFYRLGLATNPFFNTSLAPGEDPGSGTALGRDLLMSDWRVVELQGRRGAGKTHLVEWLLRRFADEGREVAYHHLSEPGPVTVPGRGVAIFALDEAQSARPADLRALAGWLSQDHGRRLLLTTHEPVGEHLAPFVVRQEAVEGVSREDLDGYLARRLAESALPDREPALVFPEETRTRLLERCEGNFLRLVDLLYQVCEELPEDGCVTPEQVVAASEALPPPPEEH